MRLISFDALRSLDISGVHTMKPADWLRRQDEVRAADVLLFPEYWQVNALTYGWKLPIFPSPASYHLGHDKIEMTRAFEAVAPAHTPLTLILPPTEHSTERVLDELVFPFVVKEVRSSMGKGVQLIEDRDAFNAYVRRNPLIYAQEYLPIRRDIRVVYVGDRVLTAYWRTAPEGGFHNNVAQGGSVNFADVPEGALRLVEAVAHTLGIDHAGFDIAEVDGHFYLLEFNVLFGTQALNQRRLRWGNIVLDYLGAKFHGTSHS